jgi:hypothetical protein
VITDDGTVLVNTTDQQQHRSSRDSDEGTRLR